MNLGVDVGAEGVEERLQLSLVLHGPVLRVLVLVPLDNLVVRTGYADAPFDGLLPESQGQNLVVTVSHVPYSLDSGRRLQLSLVLYGPVLRIFVLIPLHHR